MLGRKLMRTCHNCQVPFQNYDQKRNVLHIDYLCLSCRQKENHKRLSRAIESQR